MNQPATDASASPGAIVVGVDGSPEAERALVWASERAVAAGAPLVAVHVLTPTTALRRDMTLIDTITTWRRALLAEFHGRWTEAARAAGAHPRCVLVEDDSVANGLLKAAEREGAELVVLGVRGPGHFTDRVLGATTYKVAHRAHTPVVVVPAV